MRLRPSHETRVVFPLVVHNLLSQPLIGIHDCFDQQAQALELSEVHVFHGLIQSTISHSSPRFS